MTIEVETRYRVTLDGTVVELDEASATELVAKLAQRLLPHLGLAPAPAEAHILDPAPRHVAPLEPKAIAAQSADPDPDPEPTLDPTPARAPVPAAVAADGIVTGAWSDDEVARLRQWIAEDVTVTEMAHRLNRMRASVYSKVSGVRFAMFRESIAAVAPGWQAWEARRLLDFITAGGSDVEVIARQVKRPVEEVRPVLLHVRGESPEPDSEPDPDVEPAPAAPPPPARTPDREPVAGLKTGPDDWTREETRALIRVLGNTRGGTFREAVAATGHTTLSCDRRWRHLKQAGLITIERYNASAESVP